MKFYPLHDYVVIRQDDAETRTEGGLYLPDGWWIGDTYQSQLKPLQGTVIAVGPGKRSPTGKYAPSGLGTGDRVIFGELRGSGYRDMASGEDYLIVLTDDILGRLIETDNGINVQVLGDRVLVELDEEREESDGGVLLTRAASRAVWTGRVLAAGAGAPKWSRRTRSFYRDDHSWLVDRRVRWQEGRGCYVRLGEHDCAVLDIADVLYAWSDELDAAVSG